jgi:hypothetical protein
LNRTTGLVYTITEKGIKDPEKKLFFFEIDTHDNKLLNTILDVYEKNSLDVIFHKTKMGYHFISPTLISREKWKECHEILKNINPKCPMICLRIKSGKYPNEDLYFYKAGIRINTTSDKNIKSICNYLNKIFDFSPKLEGNLSGDPVVVEYTPKIEIKE